MKKGSDWLLIFPEHIQKRITQSIENFPVKEIADPLNHLYASASLFLANSFVWNSTYEGHSYWKWIYDYLSESEMAKGIGQLKQIPD